MAAELLRRLSAQDPAIGGGYEMAHSASIVTPHAFIHIIYQSTIAILLLVGFESVTALGAEAKRPDKDIKRGVLLSLEIQGIAVYRTVSWSQPTKRSGPLRASLWAVRRARTEVRKCLRTERRPAVRTFGHTPGTQHDAARRHAATLDATNTARDLHRTQQDDTWRHAPPRP